MKKLFFLFCFVGIFSSAQVYKNYYPSATISNAMVHTKLKVSFDIPKEQLFGEEWVSLQPYFYPTDSLILDAKSMDIHLVSINGKTAKYDYKEDKFLKIKLDKTYKKGEQYTVYIKYTANPTRVDQKGSAAIQDAKGLYFINPRGEDPDKPTQIWTQGETESNSCWFPTIDKPNQKTSEEIYITVPDKYTTLSNGLLKSQTKNPDGTRTDYWKFDKKHSPYLFFMGIGEYAIVKDKWKNIPVDYYVEKEYEPYAKDIFGLTPEMIQFYSDILNYPYPWEKYSQIVGRDYVSGAMENTTATLHAEQAQQKPGQLIDENSWETVIAHELFHHWFGDLVTTESWPNLTVNESFANYSEYLWLEHKYGLETAEEHKYDDEQGYLRQNISNRDLVRFNLNDREDMFDGVTYNKGGIILHMLRKYLGDEAFFQGLNLYLTQNKYKPAEAHQLRLALEEVSGKDLNWFFNQWYFNSGQPQLKVSYDFDEAKKTVKVTIRQSQAYKFQFPLAIDVYETDKANRNTVWVKSEEINTFEFSYKTKPQLVNINPDNAILCEIEDNKTIEQYAFQYKNATDYYSKRDALEHLAKDQTNDLAVKTLALATQDKFAGLRETAISLLDEKSSKTIGEASAILEKIVSTDPKTKVQAAAIEKLSDFNTKKYTSLFKEVALKSKSYSVKANAITALLAAGEKENAAAIANTVNDNNPGEKLEMALAKMALANQDDSKNKLVAKNLLNLLFAAKSQEDANNVFSALHKFMSGDYKLETQYIVNSFVKVYPQLKKYSPQNADPIKTFLKQGLDLKRSASNENAANESLKEQVKMLQDGVDKMN